MASSRYLKNKRQSRKTKINRKTTIRRKTGGKVENNGKKNQSNYIQTLTTQIAGGPFSYESLLTPSQSGGLVPAPAISSYPYQTMNPLSFSASLKSFGDAVYSLTQATATGIEAARNAQVATTSQMAAATAIDQAARTILANIAGDASAGTTGLYRTLLDPMVYTPPVSLAPAP